MPTIQTRNASCYWSTGRVLETRNVSIDLGTDFADDTVHGDTNRTFAPTFANFGASVTGLYDTGVAAGSNTAQIIADALAATSRNFSIYIGNSNQYFYGTGYVSVEEVSAPYDEFAAFNWAIKASGAVSHYAK